MYRDSNPSQGRYIYIHSHFLRNGETSHSKEMFVVERSLAMSFAPFPSHTRVHVDRSSAAALRYSEGQRSRRWAIKAAAARLPARRSRSASARETLSGKRLSRSHVTVPPVSDPREVKDSCSRMALLRTLVLLVAGASTALCQVPGFGYCPELDPLVKFDMEQVSPPRPLRRVLGGNESKGDVGVVVASSEGCGTRLSGCSRWWRPAASAWPATTRRTPTAKSESTTRSPADCE